MKPMTESIKYRQHKLVQFVRHNIKNIVIVDIYINNIIIKHDKMDEKSEKHKNSICRQGFKIKVLDLETYWDYD